MPEFHSGALTALVVDDEIPLLQLLGESLEEAGFTPTCFGLGAPALAALAQHRFDLMVIDIGLPDMNGMQICKSARERYGADVAILNRRQAGRCQSPAGIPISSRVRCTEAPWCRRASAMLVTP
jgi:CheY-like chemotaxis protein